MNLTSAQLATLKTDILADPTLSQIDHTSNAGYVQIAAAYNVFPGTDFFVWKSSVPVQDIYDGITWANLTPTDAPVATFNDAGIAWQNRALMCQAKQFNLQMMLAGPMGSLNAGKATLRAGLQDALSAVPSGASGASVSAGWATIRDTIISRKATRGEKLFAIVGGASADGSTAQKSATLSPTAEGPMGPGDISAAFS